MNTTNWSTSLMHCSIIAYLMMDGKEKTPRQLWEDACNSRDEWKTKYAALDERKKEMATGANMLKKIATWEEKVAELEPFKDDEPLSQTAKSYLKKYYAYLKYGKWSAALDKGNKYTNKGKLAEKDSIALCSLLDNRQYSKNTHRLTNEYLTGEPDIIHIINDGTDLYIIDVKTSWDIETFMGPIGEDLTALYWWQLQAYFAITGASSGEVSYCLVDTPESILLKEKYYLAERMNAAIDTSTDPEYLAAERDLINNMTFGDMPEKDRRIKFLVERDDEAIAKMYKRIDKAREYLAEVEKLHMVGTFKARTIGNEEMVEVAA